LPSLRRAQEILTSKLEKEQESKPLRNIMNDIIRYIEKIEHGDT